MRLNLLHPPEQIHHSWDPVHQAPHLHKPFLQPPKLLYRLPHLQITTQPNVRLTHQSLIFTDTRWSEPVHFHCASANSALISYTMSCSSPHHSVYSVNSTFFRQTSAFACPGFPVMGVAFSLRTVWVSSSQVPWLRERIAGGVARWGFTQATLGFGFETRLVEGFLLGGPVPVHLGLIHHIIFITVRIVSSWLLSLEGKHPCETTETE